MKYPHLKRLNLPLLVRSCLLICGLLGAVGGCVSAPVLPDTLTDEDYRDIAHLRAVHEDSSAVLARAHFRLGLEDFKKGALRQSMVHLEKASIMAPDWSLPPIELAKLYPLVTGDRQATITMLERAAELKPDNPRVHLQLGVAYLEAEDYPKAEAMLFRAILLKSDYAEPKLRLAQLYQRSGQWDKAIHAYQGLLKTDPDNLLYYGILADLFEQTRDIAQAEQSLLSLIRRNPKNPYSFHRLGQFYQRNGKSQQAKEAFSQAEKLQPSKEKRNLRPLLPSRR